MKKLTAMCITISILNVVLHLIAHNWAAAGGWLVAGIWQVVAYMGEKQGRYNSEHYELKRKSRRVSKKILYIWN